MNQLLAPDELPPLLQDPNEAAAYRLRRFANPTHGAQGEGLLAYILRNLGENAVKSAITLPERATRAAGDLQRGGEYDPGPALEAALMTMGGTAAGAPRGAVGAGPNRSLLLGKVHAEPPGSMYPDVWEATDPTGNVIARFSGKINNDTAHIENIHTGRNPSLEQGAERDKLLAESQNSLGLAAIRELLKQFREQNPEVKAITGERISGARLQGGYDPSAGVNAKVELTKSRD